FLYLDLMEQSRRAKRDIAAFGMPWVGILFHPRCAKDPALPVEAYFQAPNSRGAIFVVPAALPIYQGKAPEQHFVLVPDVADLDVSGKAPELVETITARAKGRTIVLLAGSVTPHKGVRYLLDVIALADPAKYFFALVGEVHWHQFGSDESRLREFY